MKRTSVVLFVFGALSMSLAVHAAAESQTWKLRAGDNLEIIAATLDIPSEELRKHNPGIVETNMQIGQKLKLPLRSFQESTMLEQELGKRQERITDLEKQKRVLEIEIVAALAQLRWQPLWLWGFWIFLGVLAFIAAGAYWLFRQTHPQVFDEPHRDRSIKDLRESQIRARSFPYDEQSGSRAGKWHLPLKRLPHGR